MAYMIRLVALGQCVADDDMEITIIY